MTLRHSKPANSSAPRTLHDLAASEHFMVGPGVLGKATAGAGPVEVLALPSGDWTYVFLDTAFINSTTTNTDSALTFAPAANSRYEVEIRLYLQSAVTTTGARPGIRWPTAGLEQNAAWMISPTSATAFASRFWGNTTLANAASTAVAVANEGFWGGGWAMFRTGASPTGAFTITLASEIAASEARIMENSFIRYRTI